MFTLELLRLAELSHPVETVERVQPDLAVQRHVASHQPGLEFLQEWSRPLTLKVLYLSLMDIMRLYQDFYVDILYVF